MCDPALGVINSLPERGKFNFSRFGADFITKTAKPESAAVESQNEAVKLGNEAVNLQNEAVKWHLLLLTVIKRRSSQRIWSIPPTGVRMSPNGVGVVPQRGVWVPPTWGFTSPN